MLNPARAPGFYQLPLDEKAKASQPMRIVVGRGARASEEEGKRRSVCSMQAMWVVVVWCSSIVALRFVTLPLALAGAVCWLAGSQRGSRFVTCCESYFVPFTE